jgi:threonine dehydratase/serine racemase
MRAPDPESVRRAAGRLEGLARRTPVLGCAELSARAGRSLVFKCENFQRTGAFKFRGAANAVASLDPAAAAAGVVTHSSGNHAQALALAARLRGIPVHVVMPAGASRTKRAAVEGYGAHVTECGLTIAEREAAVERVRLATGATLVPPYDHPDVISGQGSAALELLDEFPDLAGLVAPVGGGGLISGTALAAQGAKSGAVRVFGAEPALADDAAASKRLGAIQPQRPPVTIADGLRGQLGAWTWPIVRDRVERVVTVSEDEIVAAMRLVWERMKIVIEPSAAVAVAAVLGEEFRGLGGLDRIGVILSGGNVDLDVLPWQTGSGHR